MTRTPNEQPRADIGPDDTAFDTLIRSLDPAHVQEGAEHEARRDALLDRILAAPAEADGATEATGSATRHARRSRRAVWWLAPVAAAAAVGTALALNLPGQQQTAYASWTAEPTPITGELLTAVETACRNDLAESLSHLQDAPAAERPTTDPATARTVAAERRGDYVLTALVTSDGSDQVCLSAADRPTQVLSSSGGLASAGSPAPRALTATQVESTGGGSSSGPEGTLFIATGRVAPDTKAVTLQVSGGPTVTATVRDGNYVAWWPDSSLPTTDASGMLPPPLVGITLTTADGTTVTDPEEVGYAPVRPGPQQIANVGQGGGGSAEGDGAGTVVTVDGYAGEQVASVTVHLDGASATTSVTQGRFSVAIPSETPEADGTPTFDLTLTDGTVLHDQTPLRHAGS